MIIDKILVSPKQPSRTDIAWAKPFPEGFALYLYYNGKWQPQLLVDDRDNYNPDDDEPMDFSSEVGPDTVGTEQIMDNSVMMRDLNTEVKDKLDDTYVHNDEALYINGTKPGEE